jgi:hypothetical protein
VNDDNPRFGIRNLSTIQLISAAAVVAVAVVVAVFVFLGQGGTNVVPGSNAQVPSCDAADNEEAVATIEISGGLELSCTLDGPSGDVSPTNELIAAVWTETVDSDTFGDLIVFSIGGPVIDGQEATADPGITLGISWSRVDANGADIFDHTFSSRDGECTVTMGPLGDAGVGGSFSCPNLMDEDGHTVKVAGTFEL